MPSQKLLDELQVIYHRNKQIKLRQDLFDIDPTCHTCTGKIEHVEDCANVRLADGNEYLSHNSCFAREIQQMTHRFFGRSLT